MTSIALYRRYRPQTFEDVLGQGHVTETLQAGIREGRVAHAFLFSGSRGTGKTSTARILAKALNCEKGPTPTPCNVCETCVSITDGRSLDVIEIDAASHGGVDDVRDLRENAMLAPAIASRKIYIVDEAHMVSTQGWNAFLKTVEEPPEHVIFVFATTEPHKVLPTILSRCQRFDFRRVSSSTIADHLAEVCAAEGFTADSGALQLIARAAEGGVRDALSTLDQLASGGSITVAEASRLLGVAAGDALFEFIDSLAGGDTAAAVHAIARLVDDGQDLRVFARALVDHFRALLLTKHVEDCESLIDVTEETRARLSGQADTIAAPKLLHLLRLFIDASAEMRQQVSPRLALELAAVRATMPEVDDSAAAAIARIERLERLLDVRGTAISAADAPVIAKPASDPQPTPAVAPAEEAPQPAKKAVKKSAPEPVKAPEPPPVAPHLESSAGGLLDIEKLRRSWAVVLEEVRKQSRRVHAYVAETKPVSIDGKVLLLETPFPFHAQELEADRNARIIAAAVAGVFGVNPRIKAIAKVPDAEPDEPDFGSTEPAGDPLDIVRAGFGDVVIEE
ncbi:MAG: DNA polymerase III subunit gamma/tau [Actinomycetota bacterium]